jgi:hypothetical protein
MLYIGAKRANLTALSCRRRLEFAHECGRLFAFILPLLFVIAVLRADSEERQSREVIRSVIEPVAVSGDWRSDRSTEAISAPAMPSCGLARGMSGTAQHCAGRISEAVDASNESVRHGRNPRGTQASRSGQLKEN